MKEIAKEGKPLTEETIDHQSEGTEEGASFDEIKKVASANIGQMLQDLHHQIFQLYCFHQL